MNDAEQAIMMIFIIRKQSKRGVKEADIKGL